MAHKKSGGSAKNGRESTSKRLGVKKYGGEAIHAGSIIVGRGAHASNPAKTSAWARTTPFSPYPPARCVL